MASRDRETANESHSDFLAPLTPVQRTTKVKDVFQPQSLVVCQMDESIVSVAKKMRDANIGGIPVVRQSLRESNVLRKDNVVGFITDRDVVVRCVASLGDETSPSSMSKFTVKDYMSKELRWLGEDDDLGHAAFLMSTYQVRRLLVSKHDQLIGVLSLGDLVKETRDPVISASTIRGVSEDKSERDLESNSPAVSQPRRFSR
eukprot:TRINITY_DN1171_c0_g2_i1.p1 TRINITY_DN1171_c0_g2~~TRINITY_DN1171_c0_g2_i1.p1  ORF type:complete len:202 (+),score=38.97 TRINITY_DN1171_c0_g2_i1:268-873(+)